MDWPEAAHRGELWAAGLNVLALGALWFTRKWWRAERRDASAPAARRRPRWQEAVFFAALAGIVIFAGVLRWKVAHHSLWWDEVWQARNASVGDWKPDRQHPGALKFVPTTWAQALWNYRKPTNHPPMAVASKACHEVWRRATGAKPGEFDEFVLRLPGFVASLGAVAMIALLLRAWGLPGGGLVAALFLAIHPWHIRYGIDGRGYTFLVPLTILGIWAVWRACGPAARGAGEAHHARPSPRWWWVFGITQGLILWCHLLSLWVCFGLAAAGLCWIWRGNAGAERRRKLARFVAVQAVGAMVFFQLFTPNLLQAATWGEKNQDGRRLDGPYMLTTVSQVAGGRDVEAAYPGREFVSSFSTVFSRDDVVWRVYFFPRFYAFALVLLLVAAGLVFAWTNRRDLFDLNLCLLVACIVFLAGVALTGFYFYHRFVLAIIVPVTLLVGAGVGFVSSSAIQAVARGSVMLRLATAVGLIASGVLVYPYGNAVALAIEELEKIPRSPLRETAAALQEARERGAAIFGYGFGAEALQYYIPDLKYERNSPARPALEAALRDARAAGKPLVVAVGYEELNRQNVPDGFAVLDDQHVFVFESMPATTRFWQPQFAYRILRSVAPAAPR